MCEDLVKKIYKISKDYDVNTVKVITNHLKIEGTLCKCEDKDYKDDKCILTLMNAKVWRLEDVCNCGEAGCNCDEASLCTHEYLHINIYKIVAFSLVK